jgi:ATP-dependent DNA helicase RecQ
MMVLDEKIGRPNRDPPMPGIADAQRVLLEVFGFDQFRPGQERVIDALLSGRSSLAIFPTGGGKSLCYQLPALLLDGLTVVVSPLIALMKDQVDELTRRGVAAARLDSSLEPSAVRRVHDDLRNGRLKLLYVAPERLAGERFVASLAGRDIALLAIDEAHCISEWGHNFRPEYLKLARLAKRLKVGRVLALTATATPDVAQSIVRAFEIQPADLVQTSFHRTNLELHAIPCRSEDRPDLLIDQMRHRLPGPAIVYVTLQKTAEDLASFLADQGLPAEAYHAGLGDEIRHAVQDRFMKSASGIVVATIAFGMGIDKANIRTVLHYNLPKGPESYAQEIGRAGRDGLPARCELFACREDVTTLENFVYGDTPTREAVESLVDDLLGKGGEFDVSTYDLSGRHDVRPLVISTLLTYLELEGIIQATGPFYAEYKFKSDRPIDEIIDDFDPKRREFLSAVFARASRSRVWSTLDVSAVASELSEPRSRIVAALGYLEERGDLTVQATGARQGYRLLDASVDRSLLLDKLYVRFIDREARDVSRVHAMLAFADEPGCLTARLTSHFGEILAEPCGHCGPCLGLAHAPLPEPSRNAFTDRDRAIVKELLLENHRALATRRQLARFLCGLASPATTRAKLTRDPRFGSLADFPFSRVLKLAEAARI